MGEQIVALAGTPAGELLSVALALLSALAHAIFGAINKGGIDPFVNRGAINVSYSLMAAPFALFVVPWPTPELFRILIAVYFIHLLYEWLQSQSFHLGAFTVVYPIARGTGPLITACFAMVAFGEFLEPSQWFGLLLLSGSIVSLALVNIREKQKQGISAHGLQSAILVALATGVMIAVYTTVDAHGIRVAGNPFTFLAWFFFIGGFGFPFIAYARWRKLTVRPGLGELAARGIFGALIAFLSFGAVMLATRLGKVGEAAALRETSIIFATGIGVLIFREKIDARRLGIIAMIAVGAIMVEFH
ncbi:MAG: EamA family transporter [Nitratireductor sp.]|nr:EamA family transporter [Nitratireductor sp.]